MKALTLHQPRASLIALGVKTIETRSWSTKYRGPLAIHAGVQEVFPHSWQVGDWRCFRADGKAAPNPQPARMYNRSAGWAMRKPERPTPLPLGAVVATCTLVDVLPMADVVWDQHQHEPYIGSEGYTRLRRLYVSESQRPYGDFTAGRFAWLLADVTPLDPPVPAKGRQGLWEWTP